jgi:hypothetical protein
MYTSLLRVGIIQHLHKHTHTHTYTYILIARDPHVLEPKLHPLHEENTEIDRVL